MTYMIMQADIDRMILEALKADLNEVLDLATKEAVEKLIPKVRKQVAARVIALVQSEYTMQYDAHQMYITVRFKTGDKI